MSVWGRTARQTARRLVENSIRDELRFGDRMASESELIEVVGVSRAPLREALRLLRFLGAMEPRSGPGGGLVVTRPTTVGVASGLAMVLQSRRSTVGELLDAIATMSPGVAELAAANGSPEAVNHLERMLALLATESEGGFSSAWWRFESALGDASGNVVHATTLGSLLQIASVYPANWSARLQRQLVDDARVVVGAVADGDRILAGAVVAAAHARMTSSMKRANAELLTTWITWPTVDEWLETEVEGIE